MSLHHSSTSLILFSPLFLTFSFFPDLHFLGSAIETVNEFWSHVQLTGFAVHWEVLGRGELPIQVTALNAHPAWCASLCPSRWIQPFPRTSLSLSSPPSPPATRVETAPATDAFTSFGGFYPEQRQPGRISPAPIKPTFLCQLPPSACGMFGEVNYLMKFKSINVDVNYHTSAGLGLPLRQACDFLCPGVGVSNGRPLLMTSIRLKGHLEGAGVGREGLLPCDRTACSRRAESYGLFSNN